MKDYVGQDLAKAPRVADMPDSFGCLGEGVPDQTKKTCGETAKRSDTSLNRLIIVILGSQ